STQYTVGQSSQTTTFQGCVGIPNTDEGRVVTTVLNSSAVSQYTTGAFSFNWVYNTRESCTFVQPPLIEVNVTGFQSVSGNWSSEYVVTYGNNTLLEAEVSQSYQILNFTVAKIQDWTQNISFTSQQEQVIAFALSNSTVQKMTGSGNYYVDFVSPPIGSGNQTFSGDYYVVMDQVNGNLAIGIYVNSSITQVVGVYQMQVCRLFGWNGNYCASP
ncbi:MAG: hypothetical protein ACRECH_17985, partial [Nitrososphaerales archaeon]